MSADVRFSCPQLLLFLVMLIVIMTTATTTTVAELIRSQWRRGRGEGRRAPAFRETSQFPGFVSSTLFAQHRSRDVLVDVSGSRKPNIMRIENGFVELLNDAKTRCFKGDLCEVDHRSAKSFRGKLEPKEFTKIHLCFPEILLQNKQFQPQNVQGHVK